MAGDFGSLWLSSGTLRSPVLNPLTRSLPCSCLRQARSMTSTPSTPPPWRGRRSPPPRKATGRLPDTGTASRQREAGSTCTGALYAILRPPAAVDTHARAHTHTHLCKVCVRAYASKGQSSNVGRGGKGRQGAATLCLPPARRGFKAARVATRRGASEAASLALDFRRVCPPVAWRFCFSLPAILFPGRLSPLPVASTSRFEVPCACPQPTRNL
jgi:hypothetical protein